jgi:hypothetical protein
MTDASRATCLTRDTMLKLLSDEEVARISTAETMPALSDGAEYLDLENFDRGVQLGFNRSSQHHLVTSFVAASKASAGVRQPSVFRGRALSAAATAANSSGPCSLKSVPFGKY